MVDDPALALLLDPERLSALLRRPVRITRLRPKPGVSHTAALVGPEGVVEGWVQVLIGGARVKGDKTRSRAQELGLQSQLSRLALPQWDADLLWGSPATDPDLMSALARAGLDLDRPDVQLLRYNPLRRVVARHGDHVVRVSARRHRRRIGALAHALQAAGLPVLTPLPAHESGLSATSRMSLWPWVEGHDLAQAATREQLREAGAALARLHRVDPSRMPELPQSGWESLHQGAQDAVAQLEWAEPELARLARAAWSALPQYLSGSAPVVLHGDFSLDQCLAGEGGVWLNDLDRACLGPPELDLATVRAAALVADPSGSGKDVEALVAGYGSAAAAGVPEVPDAWVAAAVLSRVSEAWRMQEPGWEQRTERLAQLAWELAQGSPSSRWQVPASVEDAAGTLVQVERAWPVATVAGVAQVAVEGPDRDGQLRAGTLGADGRLRLLPHGEDRRLPSLAEAARGGSLLVHRAGRRAVVHREDGYLKVVRPGRASGVAAASRAGAALVGRVGLRAATVLEVGDDAVRFEALPGTPVQRLSSDESWPRIWRTWADAWVRLHLVETDLLDDLETHTAADEARVLHTWRDRALTAGVVDGTPWGERLSSTAAELEAAPPSRLVPTHRDLHDGQLLWDGQQLAVLDLDTVCRAGPALDPANLAVHAGLRRAQGLWSDSAAGEVVRCATEVAAAAEVDAVAWNLARRATLSRLVAVYAFRPRWRTRVLDWAEEEWPRLTAAGADENALICLSPDSPAGTAGWQA